MPDGPAYSTTVRASVVSQPGAPREVRVALVQTAVPQDNRLSWTIPQRIADFARFADLTREAASSRPTPDVIVWPETMFPGTTFSPPDAEIERRSGIGVPVSPDDLKVLARLGYSPSMTSESGDTLLPISFFADRLVELQSEVRVPMLIGAAGSQGLRFEGVQPRWDARFNSVFVVADGEVAPGRYDKIELTPFGEVIPYVWRWPQLQQWVVGLGAAGMAFNLSSGRAAVTLDVPIAARDGAPSAPVFGPPAPTAAPPPLPRLTVATPICFEVTRAEHCRALVYAGGVRRA
jgi:apolipoprotein N-acyltransferase